MTERQQTTNNKQQIGGGASADPRKPLGDFGERVAAAHLEAKGWRIVERNFRVREAELDIVALDGETLAFVEVRTRRGGESGLAALSVNGRKAAKLRLAAQWYIDAHPEFDDRALRVDVITVELDARGVVREVAHIEDAVRG